jgi:cbb3-type cytochrome oxidase subunit 3
VSLPHTFRPLGVRIAAYALGTMLLVLTVVIWFAFPPEIRAQFTLFQRGTIIVFALGAAAAGYALARCRLVARNGGLTIVNGYKSRTYEWNEVLAISLRPGSPWATLDLSDGTTVSAMGIQGSDGSLATNQVRQLRALVDQQSHTDRNN